MCLFTHKYERRANNFKVLCENFPQKKITVRTPIIPGFNDKTGEIARIEEFLSNYPEITWEKLNYHKFGVNKYEMLGREYSIEVNMF